MYNDYQNQPPYQRDERKVYPPQGYRYDNRQYQPVRYDNRGGAGPIIAISVVLIFLFLFGFHGFFLFPFLFFFWPVFFWGPRHRRMRYHRYHNYNNYDRRYDPYNQSWGQN